MFFGSTEETVTNPLRCSCLGWRETSSFRTGSELAELDDLGLDLSPRRPLLSPAVGRHGAEKESQDGESGETSAHRA